MLVVIAARGRRSNYIAGQVKVGEHRGVLRVQDGRMTAGKFVSSLVCQLPMSWKRASKNERWEKRQNDSTLPLIPPFRLCPLKVLIGGDRAPL